MHIITDCPICKNDFMYHTTDTHLSRPVAWDSDTKEPCSFEIICQDCYFKEKWMHKEVKVVEGTIDDDLNQYRLFVVDVRNKFHDFNIKVKVGDSNTHDWFRENELKIIDVNMELTLPELRLQLKEVNKQLDKLILLGSNDESIVDKKREIQQKIRNLKAKK